MHHPLFKYMSTPHLQGSRLQIGDDASSQVPYSAIAGRYVVVEEKFDGGNSANSFSSDAEQLLQCRGHYLTGGYRERHFNLFKQWAARHEEVLFDRLGDQYIKFGEWCFAKHTIFYNRLPHFFLEFDIYDRASGKMLSTEARFKLLAGTPVLSVPVLYAGIAPPTLKEFLTLIQEWSLAKGKLWKDDLRLATQQAGVNETKAFNETWIDDGPEGLYIKVEENDEVVERYKWVRQGFVQTITDNKTHWLDRPIIRNRLVDGADIFSDTLMVTWENLPFLPDPANLLTREEFKAKTLARFAGRCCLCPEPAVDAHHILDRKLFADGGYYFDNSAPLCPKCHLAAERSEVSVESIRQACGIEKPILVPGLFPGRQYDKWGK